MSRRRTSRRPHTSSHMHANALLLQNPGPEDREEIGFILGQIDEGLITPGQAALALASHYPAVFAEKWDELLRREETLGAVIDLMSMEEQRAFTAFYKSQGLTWEGVQQDPKGAYGALVWLKRHRDSARRL